MFLALVVGIAAAGVAAEQHPAPSGSLPPRCAIPSSTLATEPAARAATVSNVIYLNRCRGGCRITRGERSDAIDNQSSLPTRTSSMVSEFAHGDAVWDQVLDCVAEVYLPYDVIVTDVDPSPQSHHEAILAGTGDEIGLQADLGGIAPKVCEPQDNLISFSFANFYEADPRVLCELVAHESAHAFGLDHVLHCADPLSYLTACGDRFFRDHESPCGEYEARACMCGGASQNPHRMLLEVFGAGSPTPAPDPVIVIPPADSQVYEGFSVYAEVSVARGIDTVELWINGTRIDERSGQLNNDVYIFETRDYPVPDGILDLEIRASDDLGSEGLARTTVIKGAPCEHAEECLSGQYCNAGRCLDLQPTGELGEPCTVDSDCRSELCLDNGYEKRCSDTCIPENEDSCVSAGSRTFDCVESGDGDFCWPRPRRSGGCSVAPSAPGGLASLSLLLGWLMVAGRRLGSSLHRRKQRRFAVGIEQLEEQTRSTKMSGPDRGGCGMRRFRQGRSWKPPAARRYVPCRAWATHDRSRARCSRSGVWRVRDAVHGGLVGRHRSAHDRGSLDRRLFLELSLERVRIHLGFTVDRFGCPHDGRRQRFDDHGK